MKKLVYTISILLIASCTFAQDLTDALKYSNYKISGTARSAAMGNAFGALGGDFTSLGINPAGAAVYRSGEFTFTPSIGKTNIDGTYLGNVSNDSRYNVSINNLGYVTTIPTGENSESGLVSVSFGLGFNRLGSFSMNSIAEGANANHSLLKYFTDNANSPFTVGNDLDPYYEQLAWKADLIYDEGNGVYQNDITNAGYNQSQRKTTDRRGYINEYLVSFAANFNHKFYIGATLGIHDVYFKENADLYEYDEKNIIPYFNDFNFNTYLKTTGSGFNFKIGAIYKPTEQLRFGVAVHSPTFYKFNDLYDSGMESSITYSDGVTVVSPLYKPDEQGVYDYEIETPLRTILSAAYVIGKSGLISVDYEIVDYSTAKLKNGSDGYNYYEENKAIKNAYKLVGNLHLGGEFRVNKNFSLRAGYEYFPSMYKSSYGSVSNPNAQTSYSTISGGFGYRQGNFFFDAALKRAMNEEFLKLYPGAANMAQYETAQNNVIFTIGYKF
jgi:hypothetical protein